MKKLLSAFIPFALMANQTQYFEPRINSGSAVFIPKKHTKMSYSQQNKKSKRK